MISFSTPFCFPRARGLSLVLILFCLPGALWACSCGSAGPCIAHRRFGTVFLGTVLNIRTVQNEHRSPEGLLVLWGGHRLVTVRIEEDFSGQFVAGRLVEVTTGMGNGDCGYPFREGARYVVDAYGDEGRLATGICSNTREEAEAGLLLRDLRSSNGVPPPDISGEVVLRSTKHGEQAFSPKPLADIPVTVTDLSGAVHRTATDANGIYEFPVLPWSAYSIHFEMPETMMSYDKDNTLSLALPFTNAQVGAGCELNLNAYTAGGLSGRVLNEHGDAVAGIIWTTDRAPFGPQQDASGAVGSVGVDGSFRIVPLDDGVYWLSFTAEAQPHRQWFYPGVASPQGAVSVTVQGGRVTGDLRFVVMP